MCNANYQYGHRGMWRGRSAGWMGGRFGNPFRSVPVNIITKEDHFEITAYAPGLEKSGIRVSTKDDILMISYQAPEKENEQAGNYTRREYHFESFERSFLLNGKVKTDNISATYREGMIRIFLPKNPDTNKPGKDIVIE